MYKIETKKNIAENIFCMDVIAPYIAKSALPGQFVIVRTHEQGERIPLTICDFDKDKGTVTLVVQVLGASSKKICEKNQGEYISDITGPLGNPSEFIKYSDEQLNSKKILFIAGGLGSAPVYPQVKWLSMHKVKPDVIIGAKTKSMMIFENEMKFFAENVFATTDDGSYGFKGLVTDMLEDLIINQKKKYDEIIAIGPMIMMKFVALATKKYSIKTTVSLNSIMVDGTGMCGACRVNIGGKTKFTCVDGPEFDGHLVDFDEALRRQTMYKNQEQQANCKCFN
ncbi:MAG: sulfide/dihydroorotate dehydrogenase-like FAD/NAD-binding protein [Prevotellaceae bacterium]|jgi:ferredoxin--NADP+ reductase|nr:sulfide/dihydroorotate dehydrogenase-like FAD/NAD-binding protein [Prevotellaceae bacterium]